MQTHQRHVPRLGRPGQSEARPDHVLGISESPSALEGVRRQRAAWNPSVTDDLPEHLFISEAEHALLEANCLDIVSSILDHSDGS